MEIGGIPVGPKDRAGKGGSLTEDTPRYAVTNELRLHWHNFAYKYKTFKIKMPIKRRKRKKDKQERKKKKKGKQEQGTGRRFSSGEGGELIPPRQENGRPRGR